MHLSPLTVSVLSGPVIPIIVGILTKVNAPALVKGSISLFLSAVAGLLAQNIVADGGAVLSQAAIFYAAIAFVTQLAMYLGIYKPLDLNAKTAPKLGIGPAIETTATDITPKPED